MRLWSTLMTSANSLLQILREFAGWVVKKKQTSGIKFLISLFLGETSVEHCPRWRGDERKSWRGNFPPLPSLGRGDVNVERNATLRCSERHVARARAVYHFCCFSNIIRQRNVQEVRAARAAWQFLLFETNSVVACSLVVSWLGIMFSIWSLPKRPLHTFFILKCHCIPSLSLLR